MSNRPVAEYKWHLNKENKLLPCPAKVKCRFAVPGMGNHFVTKEEADIYIQEEAKKKYGSRGLRSSRRTQPTTPERAAVVAQNISAKSKAVFESPQDSLNAMRDKGMQVSSVSSVASHNFSTDDFTVSNVDVLDEAQDTLLAQIRSGDYSGIRNGLLSK